MSDEKQPTPIAPGLNPNTTNNFIALAYGNTSDSKDIGIYSKYVSGGTKYAVLYRDSATGRFKYGYTSTEPSSTVTGLTLGDIDMGYAYTTGAQISSLTASTIIGFNVSKNIASSKIPTAYSTGSCYSNAYTRVNTPSNNTWYNFGTSYSSGVCTADWSISTSTPGLGLKYTGAAALVKITYTAQFSSAFSFLCTVATGSGTPTPTESATFTDVRVWTSFAKTGSKDCQAMYGSFIKTINTNDSLIIYAARDDTSSSLVDMTSGGLSCIVLEYL